MARGFGATLGSSTSDIITTKCTTAITGQRSYAVWVNTAGDGGGAFGRLWDKGATSNQESMSVGPTSGWFFSVVWNSAIVQWQLNVTPSANVWHHFLVAYNGTSAANNPVMYVDGLVAANAIATAGPTGSLNTDTTAFTVGNRTDLLRNLDGRVGSFAVWDKVLITQPEARLMAFGMPFQKIRPENLIVGLDFSGYGHPAQDFSPFNRAGVVSGTAYTPGPPLVAPTPRPLGVIPTPKLYETSLFRTAAVSPAMDFSSMGVMICA
jgi:hypothetical protein